MANGNEERWSVRGVRLESRDNAVAAAGRDDVPIGAWLSDAIDLKVNAEREPMDLVSGKPPDRSAALPEALDLLERVVGAASTLASSPDVPKYLRSRANRLLKEMLPEPVKRGGVKLLAGPEG